MYKRQEEGDPEKDAQLFFTLASCNPDQHLNNMMKLSEMLMNEEVVKALADAKTPEDLLKIQETYLDLSLIHICRHLTRPNL